MYCLITYTLLVWVVSSTVNEGSIWCRFSFMYFKYVIIRTKWRGLNHWYGKFQLRHARGWAHVPILDVVHSVSMFMHDIACLRLHQYSPATNEHADWMQLKVFDDEFIVLAGFSYVFGDWFVCQCTELWIVHRKSGKDAATAYYLKWWNPKLSLIYHRLWELVSVSFALAFLAVSTVFQLPIQQLFGYMTIWLVIVMCNCICMSVASTHDFAAVQNLHVWRFILPLYVKYS